MVRAAATGRLDYKEAVSLDPVWLLREQIMLDDVEQESLIQFTAGKQLQQVATTVWPAGDQKGDTYKLHYDRGNAHLQAMGKLLFPYWKWDEREYYKSEVDQLRAEYVAKYGELNTPEARAQLKRDEEALKRMQLQAEQKQKNDQAALQKRTQEIQRLRSKRIKRF